jgi:two-component system, OmpR family, sensor kinase
VGRLFWKFFFFFLLAQVATVIGVSSAIWLRHRSASADLPEPIAAPVALLVDTAASTLERDGETGLRNLLEAWSRERKPAVYAVGEEGHDILGRPVYWYPGPDLPDGRGRDGLSAVRRIASGKGSLVLFGNESGPPRGPRGPGGPARPGGPGGPGSLVFPVEPIVGGLLASLVLAALLARYVSKPIRHLRSAFDAAAEGRLDVRIGPGMGRRRDELTDLGRDFDRTVARLQALVSGQRRLLHVVSHELRSPLARLQAAVGLARQDPSNVLRSMDRIEREAVRMDGMVGELLTLSRIEAGVGEGAQEEVNLGELIEEIVKDAAYEGEAARASVTFEADLAALAGTRIRGSAEMLHRALENVVRNAARHTSSPGHVRIAARHDAQRHEVIVAISDSGPGVPEPELASIFEPFFRGERAQGKDGHGLGLAIARSIVLAHRGAIVASNLPTGGFAVEIHLPA